MLVQVGFSELKSACESDFSSDLVTVTLWQCLRPAVLKRYGRVLSQTYLYPMCLMLPSVSLGPLKFQQCLSPVVCLTSMILCLLFSFAAYCLLPSFSVTMAFFPPQTVFPCFVSQTKAQTLLCLSGEGKTDQERFLLSQTLMIFELAKCIWTHGLCTHAIIGHFIPKITGISVLL